MPHAGFRTSPIVQPRSQCLHAFHHSPNPAYATVADNLNNIARFVLRERPSNNGKTLFFPSHAQAFNRIGHVFQNACQVVHCTCHRVQIIRPAKMMEHLTLVLHSFTRWTTTHLLGFTVVLGEHEADSSDSQATCRFA